MSYLRESIYGKDVEAQLEQILDLINDPVIIIDKEGTVIYVNKGYERQVGTKRERVLGRNLKKIHPNDRLLTALKSSKLVEYEEHYNETLGYSIVASFLPIRSNTDETVAVAGIGTITPVYKLNVRLSPIFSDKQERTSNKIKRHTLPAAFDSITGEDFRLLNCLNLAAQVARSDATIMLRGETGVGKELFAQGIHNSSERAGHPFVTVNCAAIPENLIESELFGYTKGAFTGARHTGKTGKVEMANKGTLFLDEIGDLSLTTQVKLLRFTQERYIEKIGGNKQIPVDVRIITATNRNLEQMVQQGEFRADLYYRLNVVPIHIPPLRERHADIPVVAHKFLDYYNNKYNKKLSFSSESMERLQDYNWPGNIRELKNVIEHAVLICSEKTITPGHIKFPVNTANAANDYTVLNLSQAVEYAEKEVIKRALEKASYNKSKAIKYLGISRGAFYAKLSKYNL